jgi:hypothetical protein
LHTSYIDAVNSEEKNPFVNDTKYLTEGQRAKIAIMTVTVLPGELLLSPTPLDHDPANSLPPT